MVQEIEVVEAEPFVVVPLETMDVSTPLPQELHPIPEESAPTSPAPPAAWEEREDAPKKKRAPAKSRAKASTTRPAHEVEHHLEPRDCSPVGEPAPPAPAAIAALSAAATPAGVANAEVLKAPAPELPPPPAPEEAPASRRGRPQGAKNKPRPAIIERVVERVEPPALSVEDIRQLLQESIRKQEFEARSQKRAHYAQLLRRR